MFLDLEFLFAGSAQENSH